MFRVKGVDSCCLHQDGTKVWQKGSCYLEGRGEVWRVGTTQGEASAPLFFPSLVMQGLTEGLSEASRHGTDNSGARHRWHPPDREGVDLRVMRVGQE